MGCLMNFKKEKMMLINDDLYVFHDVCLLIEKILSMDVPKEHKYNNGSLSGIHQYSYEKMIKELMSNEYYLHSQPNIHRFSFAVYQSFLCTVEKPQNKTHYFNILVYALYLLYFSNNLNKFNEMPVHNRNICGFKSWKGNIDKTELNLAFQKDYKNQENEYYYDNIFLDVNYADGKINNKIKLKFNFRNNNYNKRYFFDKQKKLYCFHFINTTPKIENLMEIFFKLEKEIQKMFEEKDVRNFIQRRAI